MFEEKRQYTIGTHSSQGTKLLVVAEQLAVRKVGQGRVVDGRPKVLLPIELGEDIELAKHLSGSN